MSAAADLLARLSPAARDRAVSDYLLELVTGKAAPNPHPAVADLLALPVSDRSLGEITRAMSGGGQVPGLARGLLSDILGPALNTLSRQYPAPVHRSIVAIEQVPDYRQQKFATGLDGISMADLSDASPIPIDTEADIGFEYSTGKLKRIGKILRLSRQTITNDATSRFFRNAGQAMIASCYRREADDLFAWLESNPTMADGAPMFDATNTITKTGWQRLQAVLDALDLFNGQRYDSGELVRTAPRIFLQPPRWHIEATDLTHDLLLQPLEIITVPGLTNAYFIADPAAFPVIALIGLTEQITPLLETNGKISMVRDTGLELKATHDYGFVPLTRRGIVRLTVTE